ASSPGPRRATREWSSPPLIARAVVLQREADAQAEPAIGERPRRKVGPGEVADALGEANEATAAGRVSGPISYSGRAAPVVAHLGAGHAVFARDPDGTVARAAVADHVRRPLAHRPRQERLHRFRQQAGAVLDLAGDTGSQQHLFGPVQFFNERRLAVARD